jgi:hypothetical protein
MLSYIHIHVDGKSVRTYRFLDDMKNFPKVGEEVTFSCSTWDIRYLIESIIKRPNLTRGPNSYEFHCKDLSKELYGPWRRKTEAGWFHEIDPTIMKMYPDYRKKDYIL